MSNEGDDEVVGAAVLGNDESANGNADVIAAKEIPYIPASVDLVTVSLLATHLKGAIRDVQRDMTTQLDEINVRLATWRADHQQERDYNLWKLAQEFDFDIWLMEKKIDFMSWSSGRKAVDLAIGRGNGPNADLSFAFMQRTQLRNFLQFRQGQVLDYALWLSSLPTGQAAAAAAVAAVAPEDFAAWKARHVVEYTQFKQRQDTDYTQWKTNLAHNHAFASSLQESVTRLGQTTAVAMLGTMWLAGLGAVVGSTLWCMLVIVPANRSRND